MNKTTESKNQMKTLILIVSICGILSAYELPQGIICNMATKTNDFRPLNEMLFFSLFDNGMRDIQITALHPEKEENGLVKPFLNMGTTFYVGSGIVLFIVARALFFENESAEIDKIPNIGLLVMNIIEMSALSSTWGLNGSVKISIMF